MGGFDVTPSERVDVHEKMRQDMISQSGFSPEALEGARRVLRAQHADREPTAQHGNATPVMVKGEVLRLEESHVNAHGETILTGYRRNGPHFEEVHIRQVQAGPNTRLVTETY